MLSSHIYKSITPMDNWTDSFTEITNRIAELKTHLWNKGGMTQEILEEYLVPIREELDTLWEEYSTIRSDAINLAVRIHRVGEENNE